MLAFKIHSCYILGMRTFQFSLKAILFLLLVLALNISSGVSALDIDSISVSGENTGEPLTLEEDSAVLPSSPDPETANEPQLAIRAINPGYNLPAGKNSGELIELANLSDGELDLSGISIVYTSKPTSASPEGKSTILYSFPDGATFVGDTILFRYASSPEATDGAQDLTYDTTSLAMSGSLKLVYTDPKTTEETALSSVCWLGGVECLQPFSTTVKSRSYTTIILDDETGDYTHVQDYTPSYDPDNPGVSFPRDSELEDNPGESDKPGKTDGPNEASKEKASSSTPNDPVCDGLEFSEILTYYTDSSSEQFIELHNSSSHDIPLDQCRLRYKNKTYPLSSTPENLSPNSYFVYHPSVTLTKNPTSGNLYELLDINGDTVDSLSLPHGQKKSTSYALTGRESDGSELWQVTYSPTPGTANSYQEFRTCPAGKIINPLTGNCVNDTDDDDELAPCQEGYERNPETGRCRKIRENNGADYPLVPITDTEDKTDFVALWALLGILGLGLLYVIFQFRREIYYFFRRIINKFRRRP